MARLVAILAAVALGACGVGVDDGSAEAGPAQRRAQSLETTVEAQVSVTTQVYGAPDAGEVALPQDPIPLLQVPTYALPVPMPGFTPPVPLPPH